MSVNFYTPFSSTVDVDGIDEFGMATRIRCSAANLPTGKGYAVGCLAQEKLVGKFYTNTGTTSSASFTLISASTITLATALTDAGTTTGTSLSATYSAITSGIGIESINGNTINFTTGKLFSANIGTSVTGIGYHVVGNSLTSGSLIRALSSTTGAIATYGAVSLAASGAFTTTDSTIGFVHVAGASTVTGTIMSILGGAQTTGIALNITDPSTGMTSGSLLRVITATTGVVATNGIVSIQSSGAYTSTANSGLLDVQSSGLVGAGTLVNIKLTNGIQTAATALNIEQTTTTASYTGNFVTLTGTSTTGASNLMLITSANTTAGNALKIIANGLTTGSTPTAMLISHTTSVLGAGASLLRISSTGIDTNTTTGALLDLSSSNSTAATMMMITSGITGGIGLKFVLASLTTGSAIDTTGIAATKQNFNMNSSTGSTAAPQTNAPTGFFKIGIAGTDQWVPYYNAI